ncbi:ArsR family transcriptional regulator [Brevibacterium sp. GP-SGM9]|uniref:arsenate reductase/protein-tyrosine-phosphatase family protein n=1 Tax=unclassified Brevibacterium TaxID=2614124 RepID=UPI001E4677A5|nr:MULTISPECIES: MarR family transcriptional regulator [unclassified Brevibacterium]MCD1286454.1 ArsR family transcriptional regulator [Brevibacterium sp. CCUG 69071]MDK8433822.1 helix-turn-helix domain-containing protein [Brevibacterium sp. H-BE7]
MNDERTSVVRRSALHAALGDPARLQVIDLLVLGDRSPSELIARLDLSSNLLTHHLGVLEREGLISRSPSEGDRRRSYIRLHREVLDRLGDYRGPCAQRIVFICTGNSARSPLAAALWSRRSTIPATSAGTHPARAVSPLAQRIAARHGLDISTHRPRSIENTAGPEDLLVTLCDRAHETLRDVSVIHWSVPNPSTNGTEQDYERAFGDISTRLTTLSRQLTAH